MRRRVSLLLTQLNEEHVGCSHECAEFLTVWTLGISYILDLGPLALLCVWVASPVYLHELKAPLVCMGTDHGTLIPLCA